MVTLQLSSLNSNGNIVNLNEWKCMRCTNIVTEENYPVSPVSRTQFQSSAPLHPPSSLNENQSQINSKAVFIATSVRSTSWNHQSWRSY